MGRILCFYFVVKTSDCYFQVCKKRSKAFNSLKSPNAGVPGKLTNGKPYKHIKLISLSTIRRVFDIKETEGNP